ncbi:MAG TPA: sulfite exporter TauE/SafE family protein [Candidatus Omnitrophota bacterium]|nr:sulfite exporter TauE/SafE family protein [Candidatus Omnitrophota bacterium]HPT39230.1 sulfite exporter TauE/SafE family protein [Candidatus Omnitrophota bacterium]
MNILVGALAFISEYLDSGLGMGYGTALTPILIIVGFEPLQVIPAVLISQLFTDIAACISHHKLKNVDLKIGSADFKAAALLGALGAAGVTGAVIIAIKIPKHILTIYIGSLVLVMGILVIYTIKKPMHFSWRRLMGIGLLASFNKGISGGGYGPLVMGGQLISGLNVKNAVGITAFAEATTCLVGFIIYLITGKPIDWRLVGLLTACAITAVPVAAFTVKKSPSNSLKRYVGLLMIVLGLFTILKIASGS